MCIVLSLHRRRKILKVRGVKHINTHEILATMPTMGEPHPFLHNHGYHNNAAKSVSMIEQIV